MDNTKIFDTLEKKIERLLGRLRQLEGENEKLRRAEKDSSEARGAVERLERDQEAVRERLEKLIQSLEAAEQKA